jgi:hypothetical protein
MSFLDKLEKYKSKKNLVEELNYYKSIIIKKLGNNDFKSALEKANSAITLIQDHEKFYDLKKELLEFNEIKIKIKSELSECQKLYCHRYNNLLKENLTETNLESFSKLLVMLKEEIDDKLDEFILEDLGQKINQLLKFINRVYAIVNTYKILNYQGASQQILKLVREIKDEDLPNVKALIISIYQNLLSKQFYGFSKQYDKLTLDQISYRLGLNSDQLRNFIDLIVKAPKSPIKQFDPHTQEIIFNK